MEQLNILITAGGTEEPIDGVRTISNFSTGKTGATIADMFTSAGFSVTLLTSTRGIEPLSKIEIVKYKSFSDIDNKLQLLLKEKKYIGVIHAAAISDYSVDYLESDGNKFKPSEDIKLDSSRPLTIQLKPNFKIINKIKEYSDSPLILIGFKLTRNGSKELINSKVSNLFKNKTVDYVVHNDLTFIDKNRHISTIYKNNSIYIKCKTKEELGYALVEIFKEN